VWVILTSEHEVVLLCDSWLERWLVNNLNPGKRVLVPELVSSQ